VVRLAALSAAVAILAGAAGAHGAHGEAAQWLRTGAEYQLAHAIAVIAIGRRRPTVDLLLGGSVVFAGTLYAMALGAPHWLGAITPIGGVAMIGGWLSLAFARR